MQSKWTFIWCRGRATRRNVALPRVKPAATSNRSVAASFKHPCGRCSIIFSRELCRTFSGLPEWRFRILRRDFVSRKQLLLLFLLLLIPIIINAIVLPSDLNFCTLSLKSLRSLRSSREEEIIDLPFTSLLHPNIFGFLFLHRNVRRKPKKTENVCQPSAEDEEDDKDEMLGAVKRKANMYCYDKDLLNSTKKWTFLRFF